MKIMEQIYIQDKTFTSKDFTENSLMIGEYENCIFSNCNFATSDLSAFKFIDCVFVGCNLSLATLIKTTFRDTKFKDCKMLRLHFDARKEFGLSFSFDNCQLNHSSFYKTKIKGPFFKNYVLHENDFTECDLSSCLFDNCDLAGATFDDTNLEKSDFTSAYHYSIDPVQNRIKKAKFSLAGVIGVLDKYDIKIKID